jgi:hypothetical protein
MNNDDTLTDKDLNEDAENQNIFSENKMDI